MRINQSHLLSKIRNYLAEENRDANFIEGFLKNGNAKGYCQGFSNLWEIDPDWFFSVVEKISVYGSVELSLTDKQEFDFFISNLQFYQNPSLYIPAGQGHLEKIDQIISDEKGFIRNVTGRAVLITEDVNIIYKNLELLFSKAELISITLESNILDSKSGKYKHESHQVSARKNQDGSYAFYDPNSIDGEKIFSGKSALKIMAEQINNWNHISRKNLSIGLTAFNKIHPDQLEEKISISQTHKIFHRPEDINQALTMAVRIDDQLLVKNLMDEKADPNYVINGISTPLLLSARSGQLECLNAQLNQANFKNLENSLIAAARFGQLDACLILIKKMIELNPEKNLLGVGIGTALIAATKGNYPAVVKELLQFQIADKYLIISLRAAFKSESHISQNLLIAKGVTLNDFSNDNSGMTLLEEAIVSDDLHLSKKLLNLGANPNTNGQAKRLFDVLDSSENKIAPALKSLLILSGAKIPTYKQPLAIQVAIISNRNDILQSLLESKHPANPDIADSKILTPLMIAIAKFNLPAVDLLLAAGANPKAEASPGQGNALSLVKRLLSEAVTTSNQDKIEKLNAIIIKFNESLSKTSSITQLSKSASSLQPSLINQNSLIANCREKTQKTSDSTPSKVISVSM